MRGNPWWNKIDVGLNSGHWSWRRNFLQEKNVISIKSEGGWREEGQFSNVIYINDEYERPENWALGHTGSDLRFRR